MASAHIITAIGNTWRDSFLSNSIYTTIGYSSLMNQPHSMGESAADSRDYV